MPVLFFFKGGPASALPIPLRQDRGYLRKIRYVYRNFWGHENLNSIASASGTDTNGGNSLSIETATERGLSANYSAGEGDLLHVRAFSTKGSDSG